MKMKTTLIPLLLTLAMTNLLANEMRIPYENPTNPEAWLKYRKTVQHPCVRIKPEDILRAKHNLETQNWAQNYANTLGKNADDISDRVTDEFLDMMVEITTAGSTTPCPACRDKGLRWVPNNDWQWSISSPNQIRCRQCGTVYPNEKYPETIKVQSKWDPRQVFTFIDVEPFPCFSYKFSMSNPSSIIRAKKLNYVIYRLEPLYMSYILNGKIEHAETIKKILLKIADVLPHYLVRVGYTYNEYADCDPHVACQNINNLPTDEIVAPPNKPDRSLATGYWSASRFYTAGMDGSISVAMANAYDLTYNAKYPDGTPLYTEAERLHIEKDALLESALLACADVKINNKSVGNRAGAAAVGMVLGMPDMVRFGLDGFVKTVEDWFLPDGTTSESSSYATMTMGGIYPFAYIFRNYTEPESYTPPKGSERLVNFDACRDTNYGTCWQSLVWTLQGNLRFPPMADTRFTSSIGPSYAELVAMAYPTDENISFLHAVAGKQPKYSPQNAILNRGEAVNAKPFTYHDLVFPFLSQGFLRLGTYGQDGLAVLNASNWGIHHHYDSLNLYLWKDGYELLGDLGYLWDHPDKNMTYRTLAHNLVTIDDCEQINRDRKGSFHYFALSPHVKAMRASSEAYGSKSLYERSVVQVSHGRHGSYWLDMFKAKGGLYRDYLFHGPNNDFECAGLAFGDELSIKPMLLPFVIQIATNGKATMDFKDIHVIEKEGTESGKDLAAPIPENIAKDGSSGYNLYIGNGTATLESITENGTPFLRYSIIAPDNRGTYNTAFVIGNSDGYKGDNAFLAKSSASYEITLKIRSKAPAFKVSALTWQNTRRTSKDRAGMAVKVTKLPKLDGTWEEVTMRFDLDKHGELPPQKCADGSKPWSMTWKMSDTYRFSVYSAGYPGESIRLSKDWGQRDCFNKDRGAVLPYIRRHRTGRQKDVFITAFCGYDANAELVKSIRTVELKNDVYAAYVETTLGTDVILFSECNETTLPELQTDARLAVLLDNGDAPKTAFMLEGTQLTSGRMKLTLPASSYSGNIQDAVDEKGNSWFVLDIALPDGSWVGQTLLVKDDSGIQRAYPIRRAETVEGKTRIYTKLDFIGIIARPANTWLLQGVASIR